MTKDQWKRFLFKPSEQITMLFAKPYTKELKVDRHGYIYRKDNSEHPSYIILCPTCDGKVFQCDSLEELQFASVLYTSGECEKCDKPGCVNCLNGEEMNRCEDCYKPRKGKA